MLNPEYQLALLIMSAIIIVSASIVVPVMYSRKCALSMIAIISGFPALFGLGLALIMSKTVMLKLFTIMLLAAGVILLILFLYDVIRSAGDKRFLVLYILYLAGVLYITIFNRFDEYLPWIRMDPFDHAMSMDRIRHFLLNVSLFVPLGFFLNLTNSKYTKRYCITGVLFSTCIETVQLLLSAGECDIMDIFGNGVGMLAGIVFGIITYAIRNAQRIPEKEITHGI